MKRIILKMATDFAETTALAEMRAIAKQQGYQQGDRKGRPYGSNMRHVSLHVETRRAASQPNANANADAAHRCECRCGAETGRGDGARPVSTNTAMTDTNRTRTGHCIACRTCLSHRGTKQSNLSDVRTTELQNYLPTVFENLNFKHI